MTTTIHNNEIISQARRRYLAANPLRVNAIPTVDGSFANVFRGVNVIIGSVIENAGLRTQMQQFAVEAWGRDFSGSGDDDA